MSETQAVARTLAYLTALLVALAADAQPSRAPSGEIDLGDARIHYEVAGRGTPVVLVHGWSHNRRAWDDQVPVLARAYQVVRYDRRGFGRSTGYPDITADAADLKALLDSLGLRTAAVVGHSQGAAVALRFAVAFPERVEALVLYGAPPPEGFGVPWNGPDRLPDLRGVARAHGLDSLGALVMTHTLAWVPPGRSDVMARYQSLWKSYTGRDLLEDHQPSNRVPAARMDQLRELHVPTLIVVGDHEMPYFLLVADAFAYAITGARKVVIPNAGHGAHLAQPARFNAAVLGFLTEVAAGKR